MKNIHPYIKSVFCAFLVAITYIFGKKLGSSAAPETLAALRFAISTLCFLPFINYKEFRNLTFSNSLLIILASFFGIFLYNDMLFLAIKQTSPINISLVNATIPIITLVASSIFYLKSPSLTQLVAFLLSFIGVFLVITKGVFSKELLATTQGEVIMLIGACGWVLYGFLIRSISKDLSPMFTTFITGLLGGLMLVALGLQKHSLASIHNLTSTHWLYIGYIGSIGTALVFFLYTGIIQKIGPARANLVFFTLAPLFVAIISYFFLSIPLNIWQLLGGTLVLSALIIQAK